MSHANAALTPKARLRLARLIVEEGWPPAAAAKMFLVSTVTARKWAARYRSEGVAGMSDRSSRPRSCPNRTTEELKRQIVAMRWRQRLGPVQIGGRLGVAPSTVHAVLVRCRLNRLSHINRVSGEPIRRYEHPHPGSLIHVDVTKFGNIADGGGHKFLSRQQSKANAVGQAQRTGERGKHSRPAIGTAFLHTVIDDHSRVAYVEICTDEKADTAVGVLQRAVRWFATAASPWSESCQTTDLATAASPGAMRAKTSTSPINEPAPTARRRMERSSGSIELWPTVGPTPGSTTQQASATTHCPPGSISTITTGPTPPSERCRRSAGSITTCLDITTSPGPPGASWEPGSGNCR